MSTSELVERLRIWIADNTAIDWPYPTLPPERATTLRDAALRLDELERENARLREALFETHLDLVVYTDIEVARKRLVKRRAALAGSGDK
jgi:hypothetical protein